MAPPPLVDNSVQPPAEYVKHLVECNCILPQFKYREPPLYHKFVVFSVLDSSGLVIPSYAQCQNCGVIHRVTEVGKSVIMKKESLSSLLSEEELLNNVPSDPIRDILRQYKTDYASIQQTKFILENKLWGRVVILTREEIEGMIVGKYLMILGETLWKVDSYEASTNFVAEKEDEEEEGGQINVKS